MTLEEFRNIDKETLFGQIEKYKNHDPAKLALELNKREGASSRVISEQILCGRKALKKLPKISESKLLYDNIALEQCSSEAAAIVKASLINGRKIIDLTGGLGIDDIKFSKSFEKVIYCEQNEVLAKMFEVNLKELEISNITIKNVNSIEYLKTVENNTFDWIYLDPARREGSKRSIDLDYCTPNIYENLDLFFRKSDNIMIKAAPAFDLTEAVKRFSNLTELIIVSVDNECKEVLLLLKKNKSKTNVTIKTILIDGKNFAKKTFQKKLNDDIPKKYLPVQKYFYEPDAGIIKSGLSSVAAKEFGLSFINDKCDFLTSEILMPDFPGRVFEVKNVVPFKDKLIKKYLSGLDIKKANVAKRGFRLSVSDIRKRLKIKEGGDDYLFFTSDIAGNQILIHSVK
ncbi:MAG: hypothetical protein JEY94_15415 [Melioribacteraceae bacterium]|nr:hypothetical protein [Melioribacteraceae bacterium]